MEALYGYLIKNYKENEPIFLAELQIEGMSSSNLRQQLKKLADSGTLKRFDNGIYFLPKKTIFQSGSQLTPEKVLECKYLKDCEKRCGYVSGLMFFNQMGLTSPGSPCYTKWYPTKQPPNTGKHRLRNQK